MNKSGFEQDTMIADNISKIRKARGLSQADVALALQKLGLNVTRHRLSMIERKQRPISPTLLVGLKVIWGCDWEDFFREVQAELKANL